MIIVILTMFSDFLFDLVSLLWQNPCPIKTSKKFLDGSWQPGLSRGGSGPRPQSWPENREDVAWDTVNPHAAGFLHVNVHQ